MPVGRTFIFGVDSRAQLGIGRGRVFEKVENAQAIALRERFGDLA